MAITGQVTLDQISIYQVDADPSTSGFAASIGSLASLYDGTNAKLWVKSGALNTDWAIVPRHVDGTTLVQGGILFANANGLVQQNAGTLFWDATNKKLGLGLNTPQEKIHIDSGNATASYIKFTAGTTTGQTSSDGFDIGIDTTGAAEIRQRENADLRIYTNNTLAATFTGGGKTVIGASATPIDITGASAIPQFQIIGTISVQMAQIQYSNDTIAPVFNSVKSRGATIGAQGILLQDDELGRHQFRGSDGVNFQAGASIRALVDGIPAAGSMPGRLILMTTPDGATTPVERMRISQNGHVRVVDSLQTYRKVIDYETTVSSNTTTTLTSANAGIQYFTGTSANQIVRLPDATTLVVGAWYEIKNRNTVTTLAVANNGGAVLDTTPAVSGVSVCHLLDNSNSNGVWDVRTRFEPAAQEVSSTTGMSINSTTDVLITGMTITPPAGTYRVTFDTSVVGTTNNSTYGFAIYAGGTINTSSQRDYIMTPANARYAAVTSGTVTVNGSQAIEIRGKRSAGTTTVQVRTMSIVRVG